MTGSHFNCRSRKFYLRRIGLVSTLLAVAVGLGACAEGRRVVDSDPGTAVTAAKKPAAPLACSGATFQTGTPIPNSKGGLTLTGSGWCLLSGGNTVRGGLTLQPGVKLGLLGAVTVSGGIDASGGSVVFLGFGGRVNGATTLGPNSSYKSDGGTQNGDLAFNSNGFVQLLNGARVNGDLTHAGNSGRVEFFGGSGDIRCGGIFGGFGPPGATVSGDVNLGMGGGFNDGFVAFGDPLHGPVHLVGGSINLNGNPYVEKGPPANCVSGNTIVSGTITVTGGINP